MEHVTGKSKAQVNGKKMDDAFPLQMMLRFEENVLKIEASLPREIKNCPREKFLLFIEGENFEELQFISIDDDELNTLKGLIEMNGI